MQVLSGFLLIIDTWGNARCGRCAGTGSERLFTILVYTLLTALELIKGCPQASGGDGGVYVVALPSVAVVPIAAAFRDGKN